MGGSMARILAFILFVKTVSLAGFEQTHQAAALAALGGTGSGFQGNLWASGVNPAALSRINPIEMGVSHMPDRYGITSLTASAVSLAFRTRFGSFGIRGERFGDDLYRESTGSLTYAQSILGLDLGITLNYYHVRISRYGSDVSVGLDAGVQVQVFDSLSAGLAVHDLNGPAIGSAAEPIPQEFRMGLAFHPLQPVALFLDYEKTPMFEPSLHLGIECWPIKELALRTGVTERQMQVAGGMGLRVGVIAVDYSYASHPDLGGSHIVSMGIVWGRNE